MDCQIEEIASALETLGKSFPDTDTQMSSEEFREYCKDPRAAIRQVERRIHSFISRYITPRIVCKTKTSVQVCRCAKQRAPRRALRHRTSSATKSSGSSDSSEGGEPARQTQVEPLVILQSRASAHQASSNSINKASGKRKAPDIALLKACIEALKEVVTTEVAAEILGKKSQTLLKWCHLETWPGSIRPQKVDDRWCWYIDQLAHHLGDL